MQLLVIVLIKIEKLDDLLEKIMEQGVRGATILSSTGMARQLAKNYEDYPIFGTLRYLIDLDREESKTIFMVLKDEQVNVVKKVVSQVIGDLSQPDTAVLFTLPVLSAEGVDF